MDHNESKKRLSRSIYFLYFVVFVFVFSLSLYLLVEFTDKAFPALSVIALLCAALLIFRKRGKSITP